MKIFLFFITIFTTTLLTNVVHGQEYWDYYGVPLPFPIDPPDPDTIGSIDDEKNFNDNKDPEFSSESSGSSVVGTTGGFSGGSSSGGSSSGGSSSGGSSSGGAREPTGSGDGSLGGGDSGKGSSGGTKGGGSGGGSTTGSGGSSSGGSSTGSSQSPTSSGGSSSSSGGAKGKSIIGAMEETPDKWDSWWELNQYQYTLLSTKYNKEQTNAVVPRDRAPKELIERLQKEGINHPNWRVRMMVAVAMGRLGDYSFIPDLQKRLEDSREKRPVLDVSILSLGMLQSLADEPKLFKLASSSRYSKVTRAFAIYALGLGFGQQKSVSEKLIKLYEATHNVEIRSAILTALGASKNEENVDFLTEVLDDKKTALTLKVYACHALGLLNNPKALKSLVRAYGTKKTLIRGSAILALGEIEFEEAKDQRKCQTILLQALKQEKNPQVAGFTCIALGKLGARLNKVNNAKSQKMAKSIIFRLAEKLESRHSTVKPYSALALGMIGSKYSHKLLQTAYKKDREYRNKGAYIIAMGLAKDVEALPIFLTDEKVLYKDKKLLEYALTSIGMILEDPKLRKKYERKLSIFLKKSLKQYIGYSKLVRAASIALTRMGDPALGNKDQTTMELITKLCHHKNRFVAANSVLTLGMIGGNQVSSQILKQLDSIRDTYVLIYYVVALGKIHQRDALTKVDMLYQNHNYRHTTKVHEHLSKIP